MCAGVYLPVTAVLGGRLFLRPDGFVEASRDVVRLSPDINFVLSQQVGFPLGWLAGWRGGSWGCVPGLGRGVHGQRLLVLDDIAHTPAMAQLER